MNTSASSYYTSNCVRFRNALKGITNVTTFQTEIEEIEDGAVNYSDFEGTVYLNHKEFLTISEFGDKYMVYINNPLWQTEEDEKTIKEHQWVFGYYKRLHNAINKAKAIIANGHYPMPIEVH